MQQSPSGGPLACCLTHIPLREQGSNAALESFAWYVLLKLYIKQVHKPSEDSVVGPDLPACTRQHSASQATVQPQQRGSPSYPLRPTG